MVIHISGWPVFMTDSKVTPGAHTAPTQSSVTTTPCLSRLQVWQRSWTRTRMILAQIRSLQAATEGGTGAAPSVAILGNQRSVSASRLTVGALFAPEERQILRSSQPGQRADTLSWQNLTMS